MSDHASYMPGLSLFFLYAGKAKPSYKEFGMPMPDKEAYSGHGQGSRLVPTITGQGAEPLARWDEAT